MEIIVKDLEKKFKKVVVLENINVKFEKGKIYALIGRNGSGKSVFLKMLCGFYNPTKGTILYGDVDIVKENTYPPSTRALIEKPNFLPDFSGFENLKLLAGIQNKINDETILQTLKDVNLYEERNKKYSNYSLGMKQKLGIAQVLMENPEVIILDEPFNGIEDKTAEKIRNILLEEKKKGKIIIIASHIKEDIEKLADVIYKFDACTLKEIK